jgi:hypothetical protein
MSTLGTPGVVKAHEARQQAWQAAQQAPEYVSPPLPDGLDTVHPRMEGQPTVAEQDKTHGAGLPAVDRGH